MLLIITSKLLQKRYLKGIIHKKADGNIYTALEVPGLYFYDYYYRC